MAKPKAVLSVFLDQNYKTAVTAEGNIEDMIYCCSVGFLSLAQTMMAKGSPKEKVHDFFSGLIDVTIDAAVEEYENKKGGVSDNAD